MTASAAGVATISNVVDARGLSVPPDASAATRTAASELSGDLREILDAMMANHVAHNAVGCVPTPHPCIAVLTQRSLLCQPATDAHLIVQPQYGLIPALDCVSQECYYRAPASGPSCIQ